MFHGIDLFSDTVTRPSAAMKQAMIMAEIGDEQKGEDPTTRQLEEMAADLLGHSAAVFFPSATMANEVAIRLLTEPGDELLAAEHCHLFFAETGGPAVHSAVITRPIRSPDGLFTADDVRNTFRFEQGPHYPVSRLLSIENTTNMGGGIAWPVEQLRNVLTTAKELELKTHLDGSRLFNASIKTATTPRMIAKDFDTVTLCLSKGLGCPMGAILAFDILQYQKVRRLKQLMGGAMRQSGIIAAAGIYALTNNIERLQQDHENACLLAEKLLNSGISTLIVENPQPSTNMVFFRWHSPTITPSQFLANCVSKGVRFSHVGNNRFRAVTHLDISREDIEKVVELIK
ncbi:low-specificity L-threonine aldolase [soil metagenome]